jgi:hypothetical protein
MNSRQRRLAERHQQRREKKDKIPKNTRPIVPPEPLPAYDYYTFAVKDYLSRQEEFDAGKVKALVNFSKHHKRKYKSFFK